MLLDRDFAKLCVSEFSLTEVHFMNAITFCDHLKHLLLFLLFSILPKLFHWAEERPLFLPVTLLIRKQKRILAGLNNILLVRNFL